MTTQAPAGLGTGSLPTEFSNPLDSPDPWDVVILAGQPSPGIAVVSGAGVPRKLDIREGSGMSGATVTYKGDKVSQFTVTLSLVTTDDWAKFFEWRKLLARPPRGAAAKALAIYHPALAYLGIDAVLIEDESQAEPADETGLYKVPIKMCQWRKPTPAIGTPGGAENDPSPTPQSAAERQMADLAQQVKDLAN